MKASTGYRTSKVVGASIVNDANETVGKVDDVVLGDDKMSYVVFRSVDSSASATSWSLCPMNRSARRTTS
jgi:hypothetical protein